MKVLQGTCRKVSLPMVGVAGVGWLLFIIGFGGFNNGDNFYNDIRKDHSYKLDGGITVSLGFSDAVNETIERHFPAQRADLDFFPYWCYTIACPVTLTVLVLHLFLHNLIIFGIISHILLVLCLVSGAGVLWGDGSQLFSNDVNLRELWNFPDDWRSDTYYGLWLVVEWVGSFLCILALMVYTALMPFYTASCRKTGGHDEEDKEMQSA